MPVAFSEKMTTQKDGARPSDSTQVLSEVFLHVVLACSPSTYPNVKILHLQVFSETTENESAERKLAEKQASTEEDVGKKEVLDRYILLIFM